MTQEERNAFIEAQEAAQRAAELRAREKAQAQEKALAEVAEAKAKAKQKATEEEKERKAERARRARELKREIENISYTLREMLQSEAELKEIALTAIKGISLQGDLLLYDYAKKRLLDY